MRAFRRAAVLAASVAVGLAALPSTASATGFTITASGKAAGVVVDGYNLEMVVECQAAGVGSFVSVAIVDCFTTNGVGAPSRALPGPVAATATTGRGRLEAYRLCVRAVGTDIDARFHDTGLRCDDIGIGFNRSAFATS